MPVIAKARPLGYLSCDVQYQVRIEGSEFGLTSTDAGWRNGRLSTISTKRLVWLNGDKDRVGYLVLSSYMTLVQLVQLVLLASQHRTQYVPPDQLYCMFT